MTLKKQDIHCLVFRTNLQTKSDVERIADAMNDLHGIQEWSVDLENWEKVLRVEGRGIQAREIMSRLRNSHVEIQEMSA